MLTSFFTAILIVGAGALIFALVFLYRIVHRSTENNADGYRSTVNRESYVGREGEVLTTLRPAGTAVFDGERLDVVSESDFIPAGTRVRITRVEGNRILVRPVD